jgi:hypothetical protein
MIVMWPVSVGGAALTHGYCRPAFQAEGATSGLPSLARRDRRAVRNDMRGVRKFEAKEDQEGRQVAPYTATDHFALF